MPIYEYHCQACAKLSSSFLRSINPDGIGEVEPVRDNINAARSGESPNGLDL